MLNLFKAFGALLLMLVSQNVSAYDADLATGMSMERNIAFSFHQPHRDNEFCYRLGYRDCRDARECDWDNGRCEPRRGGGGGGGNNGECRGRDRDDCRGECTWDWSERRCERDHGGGGNNGDCRGRDRDSCRGECTWDWSERRCERDHGGGNNGDCRGRDRHDCRGECSWDWNEHRCERDHGGGGNDGRCDRYDRERECRRNGCDWDRGRCHR
jgi:hypothetical protein